MQTGGPFYYNFYGFFFIILARHQYDAQVCQRNAALLYILGESYLRFSITYIRDTYIHQTISGLPFKVSMYRQRNCCDSPGLATLENGSVSC